MKVKHDELDPWIFLYLKTRFYASSDNNSYHLYFHDDDVRHFGKGKSENKDEVSAPFHERVFGDTERAFLYNSHHPQLIMAAHRISGNGDALANENPVFQPCLYSSTSTNNSYSLSLPPINNSLFVQIFFGILIITGLFQNCYGRSIKPIKFQRVPLQIKKDLIARKELPMFQEERQSIPPPSSTTFPMKSLTNPLFNSSSSSPSSEQRIPPTHMKNSTSIKPSNRKKENILKFLDVPCSSDSTCQNGGKCYIKANVKHCLCRPNFYGRHCHFNKVSQTKIASVTGGALIAFLLLSIIALFLLFHSRKSVKAKEVDKCGFHYTNTQFSSYLTHLSSAYPTTHKDSSYFDYIVKSLAKSSSKQNKMLQNNNNNNNNPFDSKNEEECNLKKETFLKYLQKAYVEGRKITENV